MEKLRCTWVEDNNLKLLELLASLGADVNAKDDLKLTCLDDAVAGRKIEMVWLLLKCKANPNLRDKKLQTPIFTAVEHENLELVQLLVDHRAVVNVDRGKSHATPKNYTPLYDLCLNGESKKLMKCLLRNGADVNKVNYSDFHTPASKKSLKALLQYCDMGMLNSIGKNVMHPYFKNNGIPLMFFKHLALLQALGFQAHPDVLKPISKSSECKNYFQKCNEELELAKSSNLSSCWVKFFNLLVDDKKKNYAGNEKLVRDFENCEGFKDFLIYGAQMRENLKMGLERRGILYKL